jgi:hypothetical protein
MALSVRYVRGVIGHVHLSAIHLQKFVAVGVLHLHDIVHRVDARIVATLDELCRVCKYYEREYRGNILTSGSK